MLVLARKLGDKVHIPLPDGREVIVTVVEIHAGFDAPRDVPIHRAENIEEGLRGKWNLASVRRPASTIPRQPPASPCSGEIAMKNKPFRDQQVRTDGGRTVLHREKPSRRLAPAKIVGKRLAVWLDPPRLVEQWENDLYHGMLDRYDSGFPLGGGPWAILSISSLDESARHDWRDFQRIKNDLLGLEWEAVELYPAESRLVDPSNRFYLWCAPRGVFAFGWEHRRVLDIDQSEAPQRAFPGNLEIP